jgi:hypothetical protein
MKKLYRKNRDSLDFTLFTQYGLITLLLAIWIPLPFINFDEHHDGLILSTIRLTKTALIQGGEYPFNQYGPFWVLPFVLLSLLVPNVFLFLGVRFLTVFFYIISAFLLWKIARLFLNHKLANVVVILFLGSQPFVSEYGSSLVPWPSSVIMPFILVIVYFSILQITEANLNMSKMPIYVGLLLPTIVLTRLQVGVLLTLVSLLSLYYSKQEFRFLKFLLGFISSTLLILIYLNYYGWLKAAFYDQIVFGSTYLSADKSTFPKPIFTFIGIVFFLLILTIGPKVLKSFHIIKSKNILLIISSIFALSMLFLIYSRSISFLSSFVVITRRFWITFAISSLLFLSVNLFYSKFKKYKFDYTSTKFPISLKMLLLFALSFQSQVYPLFDQMHFWWGSPLTFLIAVIVYKENFGISFSSLINRSLITYLATSLLLISILVPWTAQLSSDKKILPTEIGQNIYANQQNAQYQKDLQDFFHKNIDKGARVLNLCDDTNIFFEGDRYISASRFFVFWGEQMSHAPSINESFLNSKPDIVLTCGLTHAPSLRVKQEKMQQLILEKIISKPKDSIRFSGSANKIWNIYKIENNF